jgi:hypothetical protein
MVKISNNIRGFNRALREEKSLRVTSEGDFYVTYGFTSFFQRVFGLDQFAWLNISRVFRDVLKEVESIAVDIIISNSNANQADVYKDFIDSAKKILEKLEGFHSDRVREEIVLLKRDLVALLYRIEENNGGLSNSSVSNDQLISLIEAARSWKSSQVVFHDSLLSQDDIITLHEACHYSAFVDIILSNQKLLEKFLIWALRDRISIKTFIEYPSIAQKINDFDLNGRIGRMGGNLLKVVNVQNSEDGSIQKIVTLPFEGRDISILDEKRYVLFKGNYALTIQEIFEEFAKKRYGGSNLEFMAEGIINWNSFHWGWWDESAQKYQLIDLEASDWWKQLPVLEVLSLRNAREKFGTHLDGRQWNVSAIATRERATLDFEGAHAYSSIAIPQGNGKYAVYPFGKFAMKFPETLTKALLNIGHTSDATVAYPDENVYYTHRQRSRFSFAINEQQGLVYMDSIKKDMLLSRAGNLVYQIETENCAKWAHQKIEEIVGHHRIPNVFQMPFLNSEPHGFMETVFAGVKSFPESWHVPTTVIIHFLLGGYKGLWIWEEGRRVWKALTHHSFWNDTIIYHPSMLHKQQELGIIGRHVSQGVTFTKEHIHISFHQLHHKMVVFGDYVADEAAKVLRAVIALIAKIFLSQQEKITAEEEIATALVSISEVENNEVALISNSDNRCSLSASSGIESAIVKGLGMEDLKNWRLQT